MLTCKFCGIKEGQQGRSNKPVHIDRDYLCGPCATLFNKVRYQPEKLVDFDKMFYEQQCEYNHRHGGFVPMSARKSLAAKYPKHWACKECNETCTAKQDPNYTNCCVDCADKLRHSRVLPPKTAKKPRKDKGKTHARPKSFIKM